MSKSSSEFLELQFVLFGDAVINDTSLIWFYIFDYQKIIEGFQESSGVGDTRSLPSFLDNCTRIFYSLKIDIWEFWVEWKLVTSRTRKAEGKLWLILVNFSSFHSSHCLCLPAVHLLLVGARKPKRLFSSKYQQFMQWSLISSSGHSVIDREVGSHCCYPLLHCCKHLF